MKLNVLERLMLLDLLPMQGTFATLRLVRQLRERLSFSEAELSAWNVRQEGDQYKWDRNEEKEFTFAPKSLALIVDTLKARDQAGTLGFNQMTLAEKFIGQAEEEAPAENGPVS